MKNQFIKGNFKDFEGKDRTFIVAAIPEEYASISLHVQEIKNIVNTDCIECRYNMAEKSDGVLNSCRVLFGVSICNSKDAENDELGKTIAIGKAKSIKRRIGEMTFSSKMFVNYKYINEMLTKFATMIAEHPENYSKSYYSAYKKFTGKKYDIYNKFIKENVDTHEN